ncbi:translation elongation factor Ts [Blattabacterium cuenoti]|uniref:translation elongation factor Ts n=1 Tax=Blattabacterium cuenoti TaxID=1653831 RepID=UPI00163B7417|nr:translation elongation factor Ts [Blattabacterium cuenoti]
MKITTSKIKKLREITGIGIMDCKKSLIKSKGNLDKAIYILRKKGENIALNRSSIQIKEGSIISSVNPEFNKGSIIGLTCETDFLSRSTEFIEFLSFLSKKSLFYRNKNEFLSSIVENNRTIQQIIIEKMGLFCEKLELKIFENVESTIVINYTHNNKIATLVGFSICSSSSFDTSLSENILFARNIAMHITAMNPIAIDEQGIPDDLIKKEEKIIWHNINEKTKDKSNEIKEKIFLGKKRKFIMENTLLHQKYIKNEEETIQEYIRKFNEKIKINIFKRISLLR